MGNHDPYKPYWLNSVEWVTVRNEEYQKLLARVEAAEKQCETLGAMHTTMEQGLVATSRALVEAASLIESARVLAVAYNAASSEKAFTDWLERYRSRRTT